MMEIVQFLKTGKEHTTARYKKLNTVNITMQCNMNFFGST